MDTRHPFMSRDEQQLISLLAWFYLQNARADKAAALLAALDLLWPGNPATITGLALAHLRPGNQQAALDTLDQLALHGEIDARFHLIRLQALNAQERHEEAGEARLAYLEQRRHAGAERAAVGSAKAEV